MATYNFKTICTVPSAKDFVDIVLSKTQRKTPTVVRRSWKISRIREFYGRKVKFTQQNYRDKLTQILEDFPRLNELHPFYSALVGVLYSKDHYKLALGQINHARMLIDNLAKDYLHMMKFGDSLYRCKQLKRAALGRMCTITKKLAPSLGYLEEVRQHLARLPSIDPHTRTLLITGYPNVGKSSFINKVSRADVEVQPYAFTTKSIFVGHFDYRYLRWQIIDTPGILDHPLEDRNTIEMQAITALAHLHSCVLYFVDISESCGYTLKQQASLYHSIKPLFANKPLVIVANKTDLKKMEDLDPEDRALIEAMRADRNAILLTMSNVSEDGVSQVMTTACDILLQHRVAKKTAKLGDRSEELVNRIHVARPVPRDNKTRGLAIPESVLSTRSTDDVMEVEKKRTERDLEAEQGGPGVYAVDLRKYYLLANQEWKYDLVPEIMDGKNIADFVDPEIDARLEELEREEAELERQADEAGPADMETDDLDEDQKELVNQIRQKRTYMIVTNRARKTHGSIVPRTAGSKNIGDVEAHLSEMGLQTDKVRARSKTRKSSVLGKRKASQGAEVSESRPPTRAPSRSSRPSSRSREESVRPGDGYRNVKQKVAVERLVKKSQKKYAQDARAGESDRRVYSDKPRHLNSGKSGIGKRDWR